MTAHHRRLLVATVTLGTAPFDVSCQLTNWTITNGTPAGDLTYTYCADGAFYEDTDPAYTLGLKGLADWTVTGVSRWLIAHDMQTVAFAVTNHPADDNEAVMWVGTCKIMAPTAGGDVRTEELFEVTFPIVGLPTVTFPADSA